MSELIKWSELSKKLSGSDNSIRKNKIPKKDKGCIFLRHKL